MRWLKAVESEPLQEPWISLDPVEIITPQPQEALNHVAETTRIMAPMVTEWRTPRTLVMTTDLWSFTLKETDLGLETVVHAYGSNQLRAILEQVRVMVLSVE